MKTRLKILSTLVGVISTVIWLNPSQALANNYTPLAPDTGQADPALAKFYDQKPIWRTDCVKGGAIKLESDCTYITVPLSYSNPNGPVAHLFVYRLKSRGKKIASILVNPGGPGESGSEYVLQEANKWATDPITENFDMIGFDPRGIGMSSPQVKCLTTEQIDQNRKVKPLNQPLSTKQFVDSCIQNSGLDLLAHVNSMDVARDMDVIKTVVGDKKLSYIGLSYGTFIGESYLTQFPQNVRAMVLDGVINPDQTPSSRSNGQSKGFDDAMESFFKYCRTLGNKCPLGDGNDSEMFDKVNGFIDGLKNKPLPTTGMDGRQLYSADAFTGITTALYSSNFWKYLVKGFDEAFAGNGSELLRLSDAYYQRKPNGTYSNLGAADQAIICTDFHTTTSICDDWPVGYTQVPHRLSPAGLPKLMVVSTTGDPATPYQSGVDVANQLDATLLTYKGTQHLASLEGIPCVDDAVTSYMTTLEAPASITC